MPKLSLQLRTESNLLELLANGETPPCEVATENEKLITNVRIVQWDGKMMLEGTFDPTSPRTEAGLLIAKFFDARIVNCRINFEGKNPDYFTPLFPYDIPAVNPELPHEPVPSIRVKGSRKLDQSDCFLTVTEAAALLRVSPDKIKKWILAQRLEAVNVGDTRPQYRIPRYALTSLASDKARVRKCKFL